MTSFTNQEFERLTEKLTRQPNSMLFARLADYYLNRNEVDKALDLTQKGIAFHTEYATGYFILAKCLLKLRRYEEAEKALKKVLLLDSKYLLAQKYHGDLLKDIGGWDNAAEASYRRILEVDPLDEDTRAMLEALKQKQKVATEEESHYPPIEEMEPQPMMPEKLTDEDLLTVTEADEEEEPELSLEQISDRLDPDDDEARFSSILDDIFGEKLAQEERRIEDKRKIIESSVPVGRADVYVSRRTEETDETDMESDLDYPEEADLQAPEIRPDLISPEEKLEPETAPKETEANFTHISEQKIPLPTTPPVAAEPRDSRFGKKDRIVTPTLGEIYAAQGQYEKAITVFETLLEKQPDSQNYKDKISYLKQKLAEQQNLL